MQTSISSPDGIPFADEPYFDTLLMPPPGDIVMKRGWATVSDSSDKATLFPSEQDQNRRNVAIKNYMLLPRPPHLSLEGKAHAAATFFITRILLQYGVRFYNDCLQFGKDLTSIEIANTLALQQTRYTIGSRSCVGGIS
jgi:hypothetical protein